MAVDAPSIEYYVGKYNPTIRNLEYLKWQIFIFLDPCQGSGKKTSFNLYLGVPPPIAILGRSLL